MGLVGFRTGSSYARKPSAWPHGSLKIAIESRRCAQQRISEAAAKSAQAATSGGTSNADKSMRRAKLHEGTHSRASDTAYRCPYCDVLQDTMAICENVGSLVFSVKQCRNCGDVSILIQLMDAHGYEKGKIRYPTPADRPKRDFEFCPTEVEGAYGEACALFSIHSGASGAYARRALELLLEDRGYKAASLADQIVLAAKESDIDKKLPKGLLLRLEYIKEIGNFALHIRRNDELAIIPITSEEVAICLETLEDLVENLYEEPARDYRRTEALNVKLKTAGKKEIRLPEAPFLIAKSDSSRTSETE